MGSLKEKEIDFAAMRRDEKIYLQVSYDISTAETLEREVATLLAVKDAYPKLLLARTRQPEQNYEGVRIIDIADWLMRE